jgi:hypothetical protein
LFFEHAKKMLARLDGEPQPLDGVRAGPRELALDYRFDRNRSPVEGLALDRSARPERSRLISSDRGAFRAPLSCGLN